MNKLKMTFVAAMLVVAGGFVSSAAQAQVFLGPPVFGPRVVARAVVPPIPVVRRPVVSASYIAAPTYGYRSAYVGPVYSTYRPAVVAPVVIAPRAAIVTTRVRPAYVPLQPVRNAVRFSIR